MLLTILDKMWKILLPILLCYLIFALVGAILPYMFEKRVSEENKNALSTKVFTANEQGPDKICLIENVDDAFGVRVEMIRNAQSSLDIVYHTVHKSESTDAFFGEIYAAGERGVKIRLLVDGKTGAMGSDVRNLLALLDSHENIECRLYNKLNLFTPWKWNTLLHDKFIIADNTNLLLGGRNIGDRYFGGANFSGNLVNDRDVLVHRASSGGESVIESVNAYMEDIWNCPDSVRQGKKKFNISPARLAEKTLAFEENNPVFYEKTMEDYIASTLPTAKISLISNPIHTNKKEAIVGWQLYNLALSAEDSIIIQTPYSTANKQVLNALKELDDIAETKILTNSVASSPNLPAFSNYYSQRKKFLKTGADLYEYQSTNSIHGKSIIIDDRISAVGSLNMDDRSLFIDTETMLIIHSPEFAASLKEAMDDYFSRSLQVGSDNKYIADSHVEEVKASPVKKFMIFIVSIFSRLFQPLI